MILAHAYLIGSGAPNRAIPSSPGRRVEFRQQHAVLATLEDAVAVLRMPDVQIEVIEGHEQQIADAMAACGTGVMAPQAVVKMPSQPEPEPESEPVSLASRRGRPPKDWTPPAGV